MVGVGLGGLCTLLMLNCPSKRQPAPPFRGIFMELSMWPTSCLPISSWMSSPTTAGGKERHVTEAGRSGRPAPLGPLLHLRYGTDGAAPPGAHGLGPRATERKSAGQGAGESGPGIRGSQPPRSWKEPGRQQPVGPEVQDCGPQGVTTLPDARLQAGSRGSGSKGCRDPGPAFYPLCNQPCLRRSTSRGLSFLLWKMR